MTMASTPPPGTDEESGSTVRHLRRRRRCFRLPWGRAVPAASTAGLAFVAYSLVSELGGIPGRSPLRNGGGQTSPSPSPPSPPPPPSRSRGSDPSPFLVDEDGVCLNSRLYGTLHDSRPEEVERYKEDMTRSITSFPLTDRAMPRLVTLGSGSSFAFWGDAGPRPTGSAWGTDASTGTPTVVDGPTWVPPPPRRDLTRSTAVVRGGAVAHFSWFADNYGHVLHDNLPVVAWLRSVSPPDVKFVLPDTGAYRAALGFVDPTFAGTRVVWAEAGEEVRVEGDGATLTVSVGDRDPPVSMGNDLFRHLRRWIHERHPEVTPPSDRTVVYYTRRSRSLRGDGSGGRQRLASHGRVLEESHERDVVATIERAMARHGRAERLVIFDGRDDRTGETMPLADQFRTFRPASTVIGPHGSGLANVVWTDPMTSRCDSRVRVLEFVPGTDSAFVHGHSFRGYYDVLRGMPIDWHHLTYAPNSTRGTTYIRLPELERALDAMWGQTRGVERQSESESLAR